MRDRKMKMSARITVLLLAFFLLPVNVVCAEEEVTNLYALSAVLMDGDTGRVLYGKEEEVARANASTTKILTCILALEEANIDDIVTVSEYAARQPKVHAGIQEEEMYFLEDLLCSLMLESHNDSAVAIAEHVAGSVEDFAELMNEKALEIGCSTANFVTPNGLDGENEKGSHHISAKDLALIMRYCISKSPEAEKFIAITQTKSHSFREITGKRVVSCNNKNALFHMMDGVISGKTGFTGEAGYCYVCAVEQDGKTLIVALLGCGWPNNKSYKWADTKQLISYGRENYKFQNLELPQELPVLEVKRGIEKYIPLVTGESPLSQVLVTEGEEIQMKLEYMDYIKAPTRKGEVAGHIIYSIGDTVIQKVPLLLSASVEEKTFSWAFQTLCEKYSVFQITD